MATFGKIGPGPVRLGLDFFKYSVRSGMLLRGGLRRCMVW